MNRGIPIVFKIFPFIIAVIAVIIYYPSLFGEFLLDDISYFISNSVLTKLSPLDFKTIFLHPSNNWGELLPVRDYLYVLEYNLFGTRPLGYHIVSTLLYLSSAFVLYYWIKEISKDNNNLKQPNLIQQFFPEICACTVMAFFLLNPMYVESVAYISGQKDILSVFFILLSLLFLYKAGHQSKKRMWQLLLLGLVFHYLGMLSKLSAFSTIIFIPFLWLITSKKKPIVIWQMIGIWFIANIPFVFWFYYLLKISTENLMSIQTPLLERIPRALNILGVHISRIVWPTSLSFVYPFDNKWTMDVYFYIGLLFVLVTIFFLLIKRKSLTTLGLLLFGIYLLPVLQIFPEVQNGAIYDRYLAFPLIGIFLIIVSLLMKISNAHPLGYIPLMGVFSSILIWWSILTVNYIPTFKNIVNSTENNYKLYPYWVHTSYSYAKALISSGELERAEKIVIEEPILEYPKWIKGYLLGEIYYLKGEHDMAYNLLFTSSINSTKKGSFPHANYYLAKILIERKNYPLARQLLKSQLDHRRKNPFSTHAAITLIQQIDSITRGGEVSQKK